MQQLTCISQPAATTDLGQRGADGGQVRPQPVAQQLDCAAHALQHAHLRNQQQKGAWGLETEGCACDKQAAAWLGCITAAVVGAPFILSPACFTQIAPCSQSRPGAAAGRSSRQ